MRYIVREPADMFCMNILPLMIGNIIQMVKKWLLMVNCMSTVYAAEMLRFMMYVLSTYIRY